ncbi:MAG: alkaline phosphatase family protein [Gammaproteobacteria bacterium]|nr:alkaline phosphatase family protein [Gammaproteobacteria bacterium]
MIKPDYATNSIVNLMSGLLQAMGGTVADYPPLATINAQQLASKQNIILIVLDGLAYNYLMRQTGSFLYSTLESKLTSVFPSTTAAAISTYASAVAPQQHAMTGWFMYLQEVGAVSAILPFKPRVGMQSYSDVGIAMDQVVDFKTIYEQINRKSYVINQNYLVDSSYSKVSSRGAERVGYQSLSHCFDQIISLASDANQAKYIYAYWAGFDNIAHTYGINSEQAQTQFNSIDGYFAELITKLKNTDSEVLVCADHGLIDTSAEKVININDYAEIQNSLALPLCGEPRAAYCYVKPEYALSFPDIVQACLPYQCDVLSVDEILRQNFYGLGELHKKLKNRIGDYVIIMRDNYVIKDTLLGEKPFSQIGVHGGVSADEMYVPLCRVTT